MMDDAATQEVSWLRRLWRAVDLRAIAYGLLAAWAIGLLVATVQLERWQTQLSRTLVQLSADAQFRARVADQRDQVDPQWYRRKALSLLSAMDKIRANTTWTLVMPGSWNLFDNLEERLAARMEREFADIVQETMRRELYARAGQLTRVAQDRSGRHLVQADAGCQPPAVPEAPRRATVSPAELPEFTAMRDYLEALQALDKATQSWLALHQAPGDDGAEHFRRLVRYTLDAEAPRGVSAQTLELFATVRQDEVPAAAVAAGIQTALRCTLHKGMTALHARLFAQNDLLVLERQYAQRSAGLFDVRRPEPFPSAVQRLRAVHGILADQHTLLGRGGTAWMWQADLQLGPEYDALLARIAQTSVFGPAIAQGVRQHAVAAHGQMRAQLQAAVRPGGARPGLAWAPEQARIVPTADRVALRDGLSQLLQEPFMQLQDDGTVPPAPASFEQAIATVDMRKRVLRTTVAKMPDYTRPALVRLVDARLTVLAHDAAANAIRAAMPADGSGFDPYSFQAHREQVEQVQEVLSTLRAPDLAQRIGTQQAAELARRLAQVQEQISLLPLFDSRVGNFSWWQGERAPLLRAFGLHDTAAAQAWLADQFNRLDGLQQQADRYLTAAQGSLAGNPTARRLQRLGRELERYRARQSDSSMLALERYLTSSAPYLERENCTESLMTQSLPRQDDVVGLRLVQLHQGLVRRCAVLRGDLMAPSAAPSPGGGGT